MKKVLAGLAAGFLVTAGCQPAPEGPPAAEVSWPVDYAGWPELTAKPIPVAQAQWRWCRAPADDHPVMKERKRLGPHASPAIRVYANPPAHALLKAGNPGPLPIGSVIIKVKLEDLKDTAPVAVAAMVKREAGYDPAHGDWEYVYDELRQGEPPQRGRLKSCIDCHIQVAPQDYLFRKYDKSAEGP